MLDDGSREHAQESADPIGSTQTLGMMRPEGDVAIRALALPVWITRIFAPPVGHFGGHQHGD